MTVVVVYVDDILLASKTMEDEGRTLSDLSSCFKIKDLGEAGFYLGCHITRNREVRTLTFDQHIYAETVSKRFNVTETGMIPMATGMKPLSKEDGPKNPKERKGMRRIPYREAVGTLIWAATMTRPDLSFAVHNLAKFCDDPGPVPIILSQCRRHLLCRRTSRVFSLKSHQPFAKPKRAPIGRIGRER